MTKDRDFKRRVRERMAKTGESYTTARTHLRTRASGSDAPPPDLAALAGMSNEAVARRTGRDWAGWTGWLDDHSAAALPHPEIARLVATEVESGWWAQTVTVGYERIRGLRETGQRRDGAYEANRSRTVAVDATTLFRWIAEPTLRDRWLPSDVEVRVISPPRSVRLDWPDGTRVQLYVEAKGDHKARLSAQHTHLPDREALEARRAYWSDRLDTLKALLA